MRVYEDVTEDFVRDEGGERWLCRVNDKVFISVLHRMTGFGYMEWETAIVIHHDIGDRKPTWEDLDCLIIGGDRREELENVPDNKLREWYDANISGNGNSMQQIMEALKEKTR